MKTKFNLSLIVVVFCTLLAFKVGEHIELTDFLNARRTPNFITRKNVVKTLASGTTGEIKQIKKFHSGNMGFKMAITSGPNRGSTYWVYYNVKDPSIKVTSKKTQKEIPSEEISEEMAEGQSKPDGELEEDHLGTEDPEDTEMKATLDFLNNPQEKIGEITQVIIPCENKEAETLLEDDTEFRNEIVTNSSDYPSDTRDYECAKASLDNVSQKCGLNILTTNNKKSSDDIDVIDLDLNTNQILKHAKLITDNFEKSDAKAFEMVNSKRRPSAPVGIPICSANLTSIANFELCRNHQTVEAFLLRNEGPNSTVSKKDGMTSRVFHLKTEDNSISDSHLEINDIRMSKSGNSDAAIYKLMFFPRSQLPSAKVVNDRIEVTLPNREKIIFDKNSKQIIGGVLKEKPLNTNFGQSLNNNGVHYTGPGLMIKLDELNSKTVTITKGSSTCNVKKSDLWYSDANLKRTLFKEEYATDAGLNQFIQKKCGFGM